ncbi:MAG: tetratricopeptide repeat protein, partial [Ottowia sp.]|nr:tetratricopeptide repeat protein [Ottowia sp.]
MTGTRLGRALRRAVQGLLVVVCVVLFAYAALKMAGIERVHALAERTLGPEHPVVAVTLNNLGAEYRKQARYAEAEQLHKRALAIWEKQFGAEDTFVAIELNNLATLYDDQARYADAEPLHKRALAIREKARGAEHPDVAQSLNNLAELYRRQARYADAEPLLKRTITIFEKQFGTEHLNVATSLNNLATLYKAQARYADAEPLYKRALAIEEKALGAEHPSVATSLNNLAALYDKQGRYAESEPLYKRTLAILEKALGTEHPYVAASLNNLALMYESQSRYVEAEPLQKRALAIREKVLGANHPDVGNSLNNLASFYYEQGQYAEAEPLYKQALPIAAGSGEPELSWRTQGNLRNLYEKSTPNLSAFYGKQAVNTLQAVRETNMAMEAVSQRSFLKSKQEYYNKLADQLFAQNRLAEGQQVLAMLKEAEYRDFVGKSADAADDPRRTRVAYSPREAKWEQRFQDIAAKLAKADPKGAEFETIKKDMDAFFEDVKRAFADDASGEVNRLDNTSPM